MNRIKLTEVKVVKMFILIRLLEDLSKELIEKLKKELQEMVVITQQHKTDSVGLYDDIQIPTRW